MLEVAAATLSFVVVVVVAVLDSVSVALVVARGKVDDPKSTIHTIIFHEFHKFTLNIIQILTISRILCSQAVVLVCRHTRTLRLSEKPKPSKFSNIKEYIHEVIPKINLFDNFYIIRTLVR